MQHAIQVNFPSEHISDTALEAIPLRHVEFKSAEAIGEIESIDHYAGSIRKRFGLHDIHSPRCQCARDIGKKERTVLGDY